MRGETEEDWTDGPDEGEDETVLETGLEIACPYCGETVPIALDAGGGATQEYVEDCPVCCRPWQLRVRYGRDGSVDVTVDPAAG